MYVLDLWTEDDRDEAKLDCTFTGFFLFEEVLVLRRDFDFIAGLITYYS